MTLYHLNSQNELTPWIGEVIADVRYPLNIEQLWTDDELLAIGLYRFVDVPVPPGVTVDSIKYELVGNVVSPVYVLADNTDSYRKQLMQRLVNMLNDAVRPILDSYPEAERSSWVAKEAEARAFIVSQELTDAPLVTEVASLQFGQADDVTRKQQVMAMSQIIIAKADAYRAISAQVEVLRIKSTAALTAATNGTALDAVYAQFVELIGQLAAAVTQQY